MTFERIGAAIRIVTTQSGFSVYLRETFANTTVRRISQHETFATAEVVKAELYATALATINDDCAIEYTYGP